MHQQMGDGHFCVKFCGFTLARPSNVIGPIHVFYYFLFVLAWPKPMLPIGKIKGVWFRVYKSISFRPFT